MITKSHRTVFNNFKILHQNDLFARLCFAQLLSSLVAQLLEALLGLGQSVLRLAESKASCEENPLKSTNQTHIHKNNLTQICGKVFGLWRVKGTGWNGSDALLDSQPSEEHLQIN